MRHGETAWNAERRIQGQIDIPLNATGQAQARRAALGLKGLSFAALYSSDLSRAVETADALASVLGLPVRRLPALRERRFGSFESLTYAEASARYPEHYARHKARDPEFDLSGGESLAVFARRVIDCVDTLVRRHGGEQVLIVTHGGVLDVLYRRATDRPLSAQRDFDLANAAYNWLEWDADRWHVIAWADGSHLAGALDELSA